MTKEEQNNIAYLMAQVSGFLIGLSTDLSERTKPIALDLSKQLKEASSKMLDIKD